MSSSMGRCLGRCSMLNRHWGSASDGWGKYLHPLPTPRRLAGDDNDLCAWGQVMRCGVEGVHPGVTGTYDHQIRVVADNLHQCVFRKRCTRLVLLCFVLILQCRDAGDGPRWCPTLAGLEQPPHPHKSTLHKHPPWSQKIVNSRPTGKQPCHPDGRAHRPPPRHHLRHRLGWTLSRMLLRQGSPVSHEDAQGTHPLLLMRR